MIKVTGEMDKVLVAKAHDAGQDHVFRFFNELDEAGKTRLLSQVAEIDFQLLKEFENRAASEGKESEKTSDFAPPPVIPIPKSPEEKAEEAAAIEIGTKALSESRLALVMVAGGQATRLGYSGPKGAFPIGPVDTKSLFQFHAEKIAALRSRHKAKLPWYIMTSEDNDAATKNFFEKNNFFGLHANSVVFFMQPMIPAVDTRGKLILTAKDSIFLAPNGHGGLVSAMARANVFADMEHRGITDVYYFQVDNPLVKIADPAFFGHHLKQGAEFSLKSIIKAGPDEKVGLIIQRQNRYSIIEYSDLADADARALEPDGRLKFRQGNPAIHLFSLEFLKHCAKKKNCLPYHISRKPIPHVDREGRVVNPKKPNGIKFEMFIFDLLGAAKKVAVVETDRVQEFAPVKNATGVDSAETARKALTNLFGSWLEIAGVKIPRDKNGDVEGKIEISPRYALDAEELAEKIDPKLIYSGALLLS